MAEPTTLSVVGTLTPLAVTVAAALTVPVGTFNPGQANYRETVRIQCSVDCCVAFANDHITDPVATVNDMQLPGGQHEYFDVLQGTKISFIRASSAVADGIAKVTRMNKP